LLGCSDAEAPSARSACVSLLEAYSALAGDANEERRRYEKAQVHGRLIQLEEIADAIAYIVTRPRREAVNEILIRPTEQEP